ncbi:PREDICTED: 52 kDa repressor of the inhibitor of the protein kinase-like [Calidris pugnax]|uniref:52 kDa repressor of the inhibitor of the protein kinase-like n=1 Tax=Calidris pugnax TaxID=198806 RepID=UPI00071CFAB6|nr:PREDICTED: 52 kDa repressor of the inhibitor of the protein kinase-like [Calidris pugnax]
MICRSSPYRTVLRDNAVPTIFDLTSHLNNPHSRHRKRIKELSEDEIRTLKQQKIDEAFEREQATQELNESNEQNTVAEEGGEEQEEETVPLTLEETAATGLISKIMALFPVNEIIAFRSSC